MKSKRIAVYANVPADTDPSELLDDVTDFFWGGHAVDGGYGNDVTIYDPAPKEEAWE